jgi:hypothetical protein
MSSSTDDLDPSGHRWSMASHLEDRTPEQMKKAAAEMFGDENDS